jgi:protein SCO1/2
MPLFHQRFIGLSGDAGATKEAARVYQVYYERVERRDLSDYTIDHSAFIYLMDRDGQYRGFFPPGTPADRIVDVIRPLIESARHP